MTKKYIWIFVLLYIFHFEQVISQVQFQKQYGNNGQFQSVKGLVSINNHVNIFICVERCLDPSLLTPAIITLDSINEPESSYFFHPGNNCDTAYNFFSFQTVNNLNFVVGTLVKDTFGKAAICMLNSNSDTSNGFFISQNGVSTFDRIKFDSTNSCIYVTGTLDTVYNSNIDNCSFMCKFDTLLNLGWAKLISSTYDFRIRDFIVANDGSIFACCNVYDLNHIFSMIVFRMDSNGNILWAKKYETTNIKAAPNTIVFNKSGLLICGSTLDTSTNSNCTFLMQLDSNGVIQRCNHYIYLANDQNNLVSTSDNGYLISNGTIYNGYTVMGIIKLDSIGNIQWNKLYENTDWSPLYYHVNDQNGNIISAAPSITLSQPYFECLYLIKSTYAGISGCFESAFPIQNLSYNNFNVSSVNINVTNYVINKNGFSLIKDTFNLPENIICSSNSIFEPIDIYSDSYIFSSEYNSINLRVKTLNEGSANITLFNIKGELINNINSKIYSGWNDISINKTILPSGVYFIKFIMNGTTFCKKFIILKN